MCIFTCHVKVDTKPGQYGWRRAELRSCVKVKVTVLGSRP